MQFNDVLLLCKSLPLNIGQRQQYRVKSVMEVDGMEVRSLLSSFIFFTVSVIELWLNKIVNTKHTRL